MKNILFFILISFHLFSQKKPEDFGYQHLKMEFKGDNVDIIIQSKKGEEKVKKPLFLFCQGSLSQPVIKYDETGLYNTFPFDVNDFLTDFHLVIIGKPFIPISSDVKNLSPNLEYLIENDSVPKAFSDRNFLKYYVNRNNFVLKKLLKEKWVSSNTLIVAGHSEGSTIAASMTKSNNKITHLIYSAGNPYGRILNMFQQDLYFNNNYDFIDYWKEVVSKKDDITYNGGDTFKATYDFSKPKSKEILNLKIPVLVSYGTKDWNAPYNDLLYVESIRNGSENIFFQPYIGLDHNFFPLDEKRNPNYDIYNWYNVGKDWITWIKNN